MRADSVSFYLSQYLLELGLLDSKMNKFLPSQQAAAAVLFAERKLKRTGGGQNQQIFLVNDWLKMDKHSGYTLDSLSTCYQVFESLVRSMNTSQLKAVYRKFKSGKYFEVARLAQQVVPSQTSAAQPNAANGPPHNTQNAV